MALDGPLTREAARSLQAVRPGECDRGGRREEGATRSVCTWDQGSSAGRGPRRNTRSAAQERKLGPLERGGTLSGDQAAGKVRLHAKWPTREEDLGKAK